MRPRQGRRLTFVAHSRSWCNVRLDLLASIYSTLLATYLIYGPTKRNASTIGFILSVVRQMALSGLGAACLTQQFVPPFSRSRSRQVS